MKSTELMIILSLSSMIQGGIIVASIWTTSVGQHGHSAALLIPFLGASYTTWLMGDKIIKRRII